jgi:hypothetical protein
MTILPQPAHAVSCLGFGRLGRLGLHFSEQTDPIRDVNCVS